MPKKSPPNSFTDTVREVVKNIPKGQTLSYAEVAARAGNSKAARAVARIMSSNFDPDIPCHRVIHSSGEVGNYNRGGSTAKLALLTAEGWNQHS
jgi:methylated-DNA-[protein]-cysteine S-methyltransferase